MYDGPLKVCKECEKNCLCRSCILPEDKRRCYTDPSIKDNCNTSNKTTGNRHCSHHLDWVKKMVKGDS